MKVLFVATLACTLALAAPPSARADETPRTTYVTLEQQTVFVGGEVVPDINGTVLRFIRGPVGLYTFFYVDRAYADAIVGPAFAPAKWLVVSAGAGIERSDDGQWRVGGMVWMGDERFTSVTFLETGASGFWGRTEFAWRPAPWAGVGVLGDLGLGIGPRLEVNVPYVDLHLWGASLYDWKEGRPAGVAGIRLDL
jgi:hypothetical protein